MGGVRAGRLSPPVGSALAAWAQHQDSHGQRLARRTARSELLHVVRPTVAVDRFIVFAALALHRHPDWQERLWTGNDSDVKRFVQEVRRTTPLFPAVGGWAARPFPVAGQEVPRGRMVVLDLHGTNHDPHAWPDPDRFDPDR